MSSLISNTSKDNRKTVSINGFPNKDTASNFVSWFKKNFKRNFSFLIPSLRKLSEKGVFLRGFKEDELDYYNDLIPVSLGSSNITTVQICIERKMTSLHATVISKISNLCISFSEENNIELLQLEI